MNINDLIKGIEDRKIRVEFEDNRNDHRQRKEQLLHIFGVDQDALLKGMPAMWQVAEVTGTDSMLLYKTNGLITTFLMHNPKAACGAFAMGAMQTTRGLIHVQGGWSSRAGVVHRITRIKLIDVRINHCVYHLNWEVAKALADALGLDIDFTIYTDAEESDWGFFKK